MAAVELIEEKPVMEKEEDEDFIVDNNSFACAKIRATFYPKFENDKSDNETRGKMIELVSSGKANLEVSLKHSGSLFMYAGHEGGAFSKNSYGNIYTAVGVFVLGRMLQESWGAEAENKQREFNEFLQQNRICVSMELVTAVLGDHGQRPHEDYAVVTAVTELGLGKPRFYSTPEVITFCRKWRLPTNSVWLFSTRKSVMAFFKAYDAHSEEGTATTVCNSLAELADISVPGTKDHIKVQGEILEGLVARIVNSESASHLQKALEEIPVSPNPSDTQDLGPGLREIFAANRSSEEKQIRALLKSAGSAMCPDSTDWFVNDATPVAKADRSVVTKFLQCRATDYSTTKLQEMIHFMEQKKIQADLKCTLSHRKFPHFSTDSMQFKMTIHVRKDSIFHRYQKEMRDHPGLWPLYRGFFVDVHLFKLPEESTRDFSEHQNQLMDQTQSTFGSITFERSDMTNETENLMIKLKFLQYKLRTFLIRNGLSILNKQGHAAYRNYYFRQMKSWGTSSLKREEMSKMLDEWADYIQRRNINDLISSASYLSEAEPFLEQYSSKNENNQQISCMQTSEKVLDKEGEFADRPLEGKGMLVFFPGFIAGIPGCAKSALCEQIVNTPGGLGNNRPINNLMGDRTKGKYWKIVFDDMSEKPSEIFLADKNAPNEEVWQQIEDKVKTTNSVAVPIVPSSEGTDTNPFSLDALAVFIFRVLQRVNHPGRLDKDSPSVGNVILMFYSLLEGKTRKEFDEELRDRFGVLIKAPLLKEPRDPLPDSIKNILEEGLKLYQLNKALKGKSKDKYASSWSAWEKQLRDVMLRNADYLINIQVPLENVVDYVLGQLRAIANGDIQLEFKERHRLAAVSYASVSLPKHGINTLLDKIAMMDSRAKRFLDDQNVKDSLKSAHLTLAHRRCHGVAAVAFCAAFEGQKVAVDFTALVYSDKIAALEAKVGDISNEKLESKNEWPHVTIWTGPDTLAKEANNLPQLICEGKATRVDLKEPLQLKGVVELL